MDRNELRKQVIAQRAAMPEALRGHKSAEICKQLLAALDFTLALQGETGVGSVFQSAEVPSRTGNTSSDCNTDPSPVSHLVVGVYSAFPEEVQLADFIVGAYERGVRVAFPVMVRNAWGTTNVGHKMELREVSAAAYQHKQAPFLASPLATFEHESPELAAFPYVPASELGMLVVPTMAFDEHYNRLGYGGGNYDRYLTQVAPECRVVGVAFAEQQVDAVPVAEHDVPLPAIIAL